MLLIPIILIIISITLLFIQISNFKFQVKGYDVLNSPKEILLDRRPTWQVTWGAVKNYPVLGSGIGTFSNDFAKFKPIEFNQTNLWQIRFDKGANQVSEIISTMGILGFLGWLVVVGLFLMISWFVLKTRSPADERADTRRIPVTIVVYFFGLSYRPVCLLSKYFSGFSFLADFRIRGDFLGSIL